MATSFAAPVLPVGHNARSPSQSMGSKQSAHAFNSSGAINFAPSAIYVAGMGQAKTELQPEIDASADAAFSVVARTSVAFLMLALVAVLLSLATSSKWVQVVGLIALFLFAAVGSVAADLAQEDASAEG